MPAPVIIKPIPPNIPPAPKTPPIKSPRRNPFPDGVPPGNKRPPDQEDCKEICVWAIVPVKTPKRIRYQYPGEPAVEVEGESFSTVVTPPSPIRGGDTLDTWIVDSVQTTVVMEGFMRNPNGNVPFNVRNGVFTTYILSNYTPFSFTGTFVSWRLSILNPAVFNVPVDGNVGFFGTILITWRNASGQIFENAISAVNTPRTRAFFVSRNLDFLNFRNSQNIVPPSSNTGTCRFRIFNATGATIVDITRSVCPTATVIPEGCTFNEVDRKLIYRLIQPKFSNNRIVVETRANCIDVYLNTLLGQGALAIKLATECSPVGCPPPKYEIDCCEKDKCKDKKCPKGTAKRVLVGGSRLQCVDANGCVLAEIPYDPKCERVDCKC